MWTKIEYKNLYFLRTNVDQSGKVSVKYEYFRANLFRGKDAYFSDDSSEHIYGELKDMCGRPKPGKGQSLFVSKASKMPRALLRGSDYKIVLDKDKADFIVVPSPENIVSPTYRMIAYIPCSESLYIIKVVKGKFCPMLDATVANNVKTAVIKWLAVNDDQVSIYYDEIGFEKRTVFFCKKCEEYIEMLDENNHNFNYSFDNETPFIPTTEISPENLEFLVRCKDNNMFERMVFGTNWQEYPFTICTLLWMNEYYYSSNALKFVEEAIGYNYFSASNGFYDNNREISAKDWNMVQRWFMYRNGLDEEKGGYISMSKYDSDKQRIMLDCRVAVRPLYITEPSSANNLAEMLK